MFTTMKQFIVNFGLNREHIPKIIFTIVHSTTYYVGVASFRVAMDNWTYPNME